MKKNSKKKGLLIVVVLSLIISAGSLPLLFEPGLTSPEPIGRYLDGAFPAVPPSEDPYEVAFSNLTFDSPLNFNMVPGQNRIVIGQRDGKIFWFANNQSTSSKNLLLDLSNEVGVVWDGGFLGLAIHPEFGSLGNNFFYVYYIFIC